MAEFQELIKNFDRIRDYMRQFYIYGFKARTEFDGKSARTYDNERRRIESWLADYTRADYTSRGKHVYINVDSKEIPQNPLYTAWKSKSFTDNDLMLHFFILDQLVEPDIANTSGLTAGELCDRISQDYGVVFDSQTVRLKLKEYEGLGILRSAREGKLLRYRLDDFLTPETAVSPAWEHLITAVKFFQGAAPFGFIGSTILDREEDENDWFQFKHQFIVHTLEDGVLADVLTAIREEREISYTNRSGRTGNISQGRGLPLKIFVSTRSGRRYACLYFADKRRFNNVRLDAMTGITLLEPCPDFPRKKDLLRRNLDRLWGVSFSGSGRLEEICIKLYINEAKESYVLDRLFREGRGGQIEKIRDNEFLYTGAFFDTNEMLSWVKTFTGRILDIQGSNRFAIAKVTYDWEKMYEMYCRNGGELEDEP